MKQKFYSLKKLKEKNAEYNLIYGERSNGKSYAVAENALRDSWDNGEELIYLRRWQLEVKSAQVEAYFRDKPISAITDGKCNAITYFRGELFFSNVKDDLSIERIKKCGYVMYLSGETHYKSANYNKVKNVIFEEFITGDGYLLDEPHKLMNLISTIARRNRIYVYMIGNAISRTCPYFREWELTNIPKQEQGSIDVYEKHTGEIDDNGNEIIVHIAVEYAENSGHNSKMFFNENMITSGNWVCKEKAHLLKRYIEYNSIYQILIEKSGFQYVMEVLKDKANGELTLYVYPYTGKREIKRVITDKYNTDILSTSTFLVLTNGDKYIKMLLEREKICYSDNLTGTEFSELILEGGVM